MHQAFFILLLTVLMNTANAEYRVFMLQVTGPDGVVSKSFPSTLDPEQYRLYHPLPAAMKLSYQETWMCKGNTQDFKALCSNPNPPIEDANKTKPNVEQPPSQTPNTPTEKTATNPP